MVICALTIGKVLGQSINEGTSRKGEQIEYTLSFHVNNDPKFIYNKFDQDFGESFFETETAATVWAHVVIKDWSKTRVTIRLLRIQDDSGSNLYITCVDDNNIDLLKPGSQSQSKIKKYLVEVAR